MDSTRRLYSLSRPAPPVGPAPRRSQAQGTARVTAGRPPPSTTLEAPGRARTGRSKTVRPGRTCPWQSVTYSRATLCVSWRSCRNMCASCVRAHRTSPLDETSKRPRKPKPASLSSKMGLAGNQARRKCDSCRGDRAASGLASCCCCCSSSSPPVAFRVPPSPSTSQCGGLWTIAQSPPYSTTAGDAAGSARGGRAASTAGTAAAREPAPRRSRTRPAR
mmetsp:Transcript_28091/g.88855  ORF Transcript_28091/g.88855 Transcript_28091/m.88855 type:complete len:219 (-) Transcript_28091:272-928(-)